MRYLNRLPGTRRYPPGLEWHILRRLPLALVASTVIPLSWYLMAWMHPLPAAGESVEKYLSTVAIGAAATAVFAWTAIFTLAIGCVIVVVMKGPAYVADPYPLPDADRPRAHASQGADRQP